MDETRSAHPLYGPTQPRRRKANVDYYFENYQGWSGASQWIVQQPNLPEGLKVVREEQVEPDASARRLIKLINSDLTPLRYVAVLAVGEGYTEIDYGDAGINVGIWPAEGSVKVSSSDFASLKAAIAFEPDLPLSAFEWRFNAENGLLVWFNKENGEKRAAIATS